MALSAEDLLGQNQDNTLQDVAPQQALPSNPLPDLSVNTLPSSATPPPPAFSVEDLIQGAMPDSTAPAPDVAQPITYNPADTSLTDPLAELLNQAPQTAAAPQMPQGWAPPPLPVAQTAPAPTAAPVHQPSGNPLVDFGRPGTQENKGYNDFFNWAGGLEKQSRSVVNQVYDFLNGVPSKDQFTRQRDDMKQQVTGLFGADVANQVDKFNVWAYNLRQDPLGYGINVSNVLSSGMQSAAQYGAPQMMATIWRPILSHLTGENIPATPLELEQEQSSLGANPTSQQVARYNQDLQKSTDFWQHSAYGKIAALGGQLDIAPAAFALGKYQFIAGLVNDPVNTVKGVLDSVGGARDFVSQAVSNPSSLSADQWSKGINDLVTVGYAAHGAADLMHAGLHNALKQNEAVAQEGTPTATLAPDMQRNPEPQPVAKEEVPGIVQSAVQANPAASAVTQALSPLGKVSAVGGIVRDAAMGKVQANDGFHDIDLQAAVPEEQLVSTLQAVAAADPTGQTQLIKTGDNFPVYRFIQGGHQVEIALPRAENPENTNEYVSDHTVPLTDDLARRDFTHNAMAVDLGTGELHDPYGGLDAIKGGQLSTVSPKAFLGDPNRILRGLTRVSKDGMSLSPETEAQMAEHAHLLAGVAPERKGEELTSIFTGKDPASAMEIAQRTGVLHEIIPELDQTVGFDQKNRYHNQQLWDHLLGVLRAAQQLTKDPDERIAAFLHDIGKPESQWLDENGHAHYYENLAQNKLAHEEVGTRIAREVLTRLKFPNNRIEKIVHLIRHHMFVGFNTTKGAARFLKDRVYHGLDDVDREVREHIADQRVRALMRLREADQFNHSAPNDGNVQRMLEHVNAVRDMKIPTSRRDLAINGDDLQTYGVIQPGPGMGKLLTVLHDLTLLDPEDPHYVANDKAALIAAAKHIAETGELPRGAMPTEAVMNKASRPIGVLDNLPAEKVLLKPGEAPIKPGYIRLYHYTHSREALAAIHENGISAASARGETYGEPNMVWGSTKVPGPDSSFVEFAVKPEQIAIGHPTSMGGGPMTQAQIDDFQRGSHDVTLYGDVKPDQLLATHEDWHGTYQYINENPNIAKEIRNGDFNWLLESKQDDKDRQGMLRWIQDHPEDAPRTNGGEPIANKSTALRGKQQELFGTGEDLPLFSGVNQEAPEEPLPEAPKAPTNTIPEGQMGFEGINAMRQSVVPLSPYQPVDLATINSHMEAGGHDLLPGDQVREGFLLPDGTGYDLKKGNFSYNDEATHANMVRQIFGNASRASWARLFKQGWIRIHGDSIMAWRFDDKTLARIEANIKRDRRWDNHGARVFDDQVVLHEASTGREYRLDLNELKDNGYYIRPLLRHSFIRESEEGKFRVEDRQGEQHGIQQTTTSLRRETGKVSKSRQTGQAREGGKASQGGQSEADYEPPKRGEAAHPILNAEAANAERFTPSAIATGATGPSGNAGAGEGAIGTSSVGTGNVPSDTGNANGASAVGTGSLPSNAADAGEAANATATADATGLSTANAGGTATVGPTAEAGLTGGTASPGAGSRWTVRITGLLDKANFDHAENAQKLMQNVVDMIHTLGINDNGLINHIGIGRDVEYGNFPDYAKGVFLPGANRMVKADANLVLLPAEIQGQRTQHAALLNQAKDVLSHMEAEARAIAKSEGVDGILPYHAAKLEALRNSVEEGAATQKRILDMTPEQWMVATLGHEIMHSQTMNAIYEQYQKALFKQTQPHGNYQEFLNTWEGGKRGWPEWTFGEQAYAMARLMPEVLDHLAATGQARHAANIRQWADIVDKTEGVQSGELATNVPARGPGSLGPYAEHAWLAPHIRASVYTLNEHLNQLAMAAYNVAPWRLSTETKETYETTFYNSAAREAAISQVRDWFEANRLTADEAASVHTGYTADTARRLSAVPETTPTQQQAANSTVPAVTSDRSGNDTAANQAGLERESAFAVAQKRVSAPDPGEAKKAAKVLKFARASAADLQLKRGIVPSPEQMAETLARGMGLKLDEARAMLANAANGTDPRALARVQSWGDDFRAALGGEAARVVSTDKSQSAGEYQPVLGLSANDILDLVPLREGHSDEADLVDKNAERAQHIQDWKVLRGAVLRGGGLAAERNGIDRYSIPGGLYRKAGMTLDQVPIQMLDETGEGRWGQAHGEASGNEVLQHIQDIHAKYKDAKEFLASLKKPAMAKGVKGSLVEKPTKTEDVMERVQRFVGDNQADRENFQMSLDQAEETYQDVPGENTDKIYQEALKDYADRIDSGELPRPEHWKAAGVNFATSEELANEKQAKAEAKVADEAAMAPEASQAPVEALPHQADVLRQADLANSMPGEETEKLATDGEAEKSVAEHIEHVAGLAPEEIDSQVAKDEAEWADLLEDQESWDAGQPTTPLGNIQEAIQEEDAKETLRRAEQESAPYEPPFAFEKPVPVGVGAPEAAAGAQEALPGLGGNGNRVPPPPTGGGAGAGGGGKGSKGEDSSSAYSAGYNAALHGARDVEELKALADSLHATVERFMSRLNLNNFAQHPKQWFKGYADSIREMRVYYHHTAKKIDEFMNNESSRLAGAGATKEQVAEQKSTLNDAVLKVLEGEEKERLQAMTDLKAISPNAALVGDVLHEYWSTTGNILRDPKRQVFKYFLENYLPHIILQVPDKFRSETLRSKSSTTFGGGMSKGTRHAWRRAVDAEGEPLHKNIKSLEDEGYVMQHNIADIFRAHGYAVSRASRMREMIHMFQRMIWHENGESDQAYKDGSFHGHPIIPENSYQATKAEGGEEIKGWRDLSSADKDNYRTIKMGQTETPMDGFYVEKGLAEYLERLSRLDEQPGVPQTVARWINYANNGFKIYKFSLFNPIHAWNMLSNISTLAYRTGYTGIGPLDYRLWFGNDSLHGRGEAALQDPALVGEAVANGYTAPMDIMQDADVGTFGHGIDTLFARIPGWKQWHNFMWNEVAYKTGLGLYFHLRDRMVADATRRDGRAPTDQEMASIRQMAAEHAKNGVGFLDQLDMTKDYRLFGGSLFLANKWTTAQIRSLFRAMGLKTLGNLGGGESYRYTTPTLDKINAETYRRLVFGGTARLLATAIIGSTAMSYALTGQVNTPMQNYLRDPLHTFDVYGGVDGSGKDIWYHNPFYGFQRELADYGMASLKAYRAGKGPWQIAEAPFQRFANKANPIAKMTYEQISGVELGREINNFSDPSIDNDNTIKGIHQMLDAHGAPNLGSVENRLIWLFKSFGTPGLAGTAPIAPSSIAATALGSREDVGVPVAQTAQIDAQVAAGQQKQDLTGQMIQAVKNGDFATAAKLRQQLDITASQATAKVLYGAAHSGSGILYTGVDDTGTPVSTRPDVLFGHQLNAQQSAEFQTAKFEREAKVWDYLQTLPEYKTGNASVRSELMQEYLRFADRVTDEMYGQRYGLKPGQTISPTQGDAMLGEAKSLTDSTIKMIQGTALYTNGTPQDQVLIEKEYAAAAQTAIFNKHFGNYKNVSTAQLQSMLVTRANVEQVTRQYMQTLPEFQDAQPYEQDTMMKNAVTYANRLTENAIAGKHEAGMTRALNANELSSVVTNSLALESAAKQMLHQSSIYTTADPTRQALLDNRYADLAHKIALYDARDQVHVNVGDLPALYKQGFGQALQGRLMADEGFSQLMAPYGGEANILAHEQRLTAIKLQFNQQANVPPDRLAQYDTLVQHWYESQNPDYAAWVRVRANWELHNPVGQLYMALQKNELNFAARSPLSMFDLMGNPQSQA